MCLGDLLYVLDETKINNGILINIAGKELFYSTKQISELKEKYRANIMDSFYPYISHEGVQLVVYLSERKFYEPKKEEV